MMTKQVPEIQEKPIQPEVVSEIPQNKNFFKTVLLVVLGLIVVAGAVYAGYQIGRRSLSPREFLIPPKPITTQIPVVETSPSPTPDPTANWKTYTNIKYRYSVKFPINFKATEMGMGTGNLGTAWGIRITDVAVNDWLKEPQMTIEVLQKSSKSLEQIARENYKANFDFKGHSPTPLVELHESRFLGRSSYKYILRNDAFQGPTEGFVGLNGEYKVLWLENGDNIFMVMRVGSEIFDQILSTFRFLD